LLTSDFGDVYLGSGRDGFISDYMPDVQEAFSTMFDFIAEVVTEEQQDAITQILQGMGDIQITREMLADGTFLDPVFNMVLSTFDEGIQRFVREAGSSIEERIEALGAAIQLDDMVVATGIFDDLGDALDQIGDHQMAGEEFANTVLRVTGGMELLQAAFLVLDQDVTSIGENWITLSAEFTEAAGGLQRATSLWTGFLNDYLTDAEQLAFRQEQASAVARTELADVGLVDDLTSYTRDGLRQMFEELLPTLTGDELTEWLEALNAFSGWLGTLPEQIDDVVGREMPTIGRFQDPVTFEYPGGDDPYQAPYQDQNYYGPFGGPGGEMSIFGAGPSFGAAVGADGYLVGPSGVSIGASGGTVGAGGGYTRVVHPQLGEIWVAPNGQFQAAPPATFQFSDGGPVEVTVSNMDELQQTIVAEEARVTQSAQQAVNALFGSQIDRLNEEIARFSGLNPSSEMGVLVASNQLPDLIAERDALVEQQRRAQELAVAGGLAQNIADLSGIRGSSYSDVASSLGFDLNMLGQVLGLDPDGLDAHLRQLEADSVTLSGLTELINGAAGSISEVFNAALGSDGKAFTSTMKSGADTIQAAANDMLVAADLMVSSVGGAQPTRGAKSATFNARTRSTA